MPYIHFNNNKKGKISLADFFKLKDSVKTSNQDFINFCIEKDLNHYNPDEVNFFNNADKVKNAVKSFTKKQREDTLIANMSYVDTMIYYAIKYQIWNVICGNSQEAEYSKEKLDHPCYIEFKPENLKTSTKGESLSPISFKVGYVNPSDELQKRFEEAKSLNKPNTLFEIAKNVLDLKNMTKPNDEYLTISKKYQVEIPTTQLKSKSLGGLNI
jgi:hypothetical protein